MRTLDLDFDFDPSLVAREPANPRDSARLLVYERANGEVRHRQVRDLVEYLAAGDALVVNETTVAPARVKAVRGEGGARIEGLLLERRGERRWWALLRNTKRLRPGDRLRLVGPHEAAGGPRTEYELRFDGREGEGSLVELLGDRGADAILADVGWTPLPPYILKARKDAGQVDDGHEDDADRRRYQTIFAAPTEAPSVAAPTAGLHFTEPLLAALAAKGVERIPVSLQVGAGTFKTVETERLEDHPMHTERCLIRRDALERLRQARERSERGAGRVVAVGTTSVRTLESLPGTLGEVAARLPADADRIAWETDILIAPGHRPRLVDALMTNFHLPRSTLLALVAAFIGLEELRRVYAIATRERYRFYSYGDAMLIL